MLTDYDNYFGNREALDEAFWQNIDDENDCNWIDFVALSTPFAPTVSQWLCNETLLKFAETFQSHENTTSFDKKCFSDSVTIKVQCDQFDVLIQRLDDHFTLLQARDSNNNDYSENFWHGGVESNELRKYFVAHCDHLGMLGQPLYLRLLRRSDQPCFALACLQMEEDKLCPHWRPAVANTADTAVEFLSLQSSHSDNWVHLEQHFVDLLQQKNNGVAVKAALFQLFWFFGVCDAFGFGLCEQSLFWQQVFFVSQSVDFVIYADDCTTSHGDGKSPTRSKRVHSPGRKFYVPCDNGLLSVPRVCGFFGKKPADFTTHFYDDVDVCDVTNKEHDQYFEQAEYHVGDETICALEPREADLQLPQVSFAAQNRKDLRETLVIPFIAFLLHKNLLKDAAFDDLRDWMQCIVDDFKLSFLSFLNADWTNCFSETPFGNKVNNKNIFFFAKKKFNTCNISALCMHHIKDSVLCVYDEQRGRFHTDVTLCNRDSQI